MPSCDNLSLLAVFCPLALWASSLPFHVIVWIYCFIAIAVSLLVSFTLTPMLSARLIKPSKDREDSPDDKPAKHDSKQGRFYRPIDRGYTRMLTWSMTHRWVVVLACLAVIISIVPLFMFVGKNFLPVTSVTVENNCRPEGIDISSTSAIAVRIATTSAASRCSTLQNRRWSTER